MTNQMTTKVRLVRCPRCWELLREPADVPVYSCGGCGTVLQVKNWKNNTNHKGSDLHETDASQKNESEHCAEKKEADSLNQAAVLPSMGESALDKNNGRDQYESGECNGKQPVGIVSSDEPSSLTQLTCHENEESSLEARDHMKVDEKCSLDRENGQNQIEFGDCNRNWSGGINLSKEPSSSAELTCHENEESSPEARTHVEADEDKCSLNRENGRYQNKFGECSREWPGGTNSSDESSSSTELISHENEESSPEAKRHVIPGEDKGYVVGENGRDQNCSREWPGGTNLSDESSSSTELIYHENEESSPEARRHVEPDEDKGYLVGENGRDQNCNREWPGGTNLSDEPSSSTELTCHENIEFSPEAITHVKAYEDKWSLEGDIGRDQNKFGDCNRQWPGGINSSSDEPSSSTELTCHENEESSPEARTHVEPDEDKCSLEGENGRDQNKFGDCNREWPGGINSSSDEPSSSTELTCHENEESSPEARTHVEPDEGKCSLEGENGRDQNCNREWPGGTSLSDELPSSTELTCHENEEFSHEAMPHVEADEDECSVDSSLTKLNCHENELSPIATAHIEVDENKYSLEQSNGRDHDEYGDCNQDWPRKVNVSNEIASSTELTCHEIEESSLISGEDENFRTRFFFRSSNTGDLLATRPRDSTITAQRPMDESMSSDNLTSVYNEQLQQSLKSVLHHSDWVRSVDTLENTLVNTSSELSVTHGEMSKSPTRSYYAYDGSVSSYDGIDDQVHDRHLDLSERNFNDADFISTKRTPRRDKLLVQHQAGTSSTFSSEKNHHAMKSSKWHQDDLLESTRYGHPVCWGMRLETDEHQSRLPFYSRGSQADSGNVCPSSNREDEFQCRSGSHSPDKLKYTEQDRMKLLQMVCELQDQLKRTHISKRKANGRFPAGVSQKEKQMPLYYDHVAPDAEIYHNINCHRYPGRCSQGKSWSQQCEVSQIPFIREATEKRHQVDYACLHCYPKDRHCSAQLPPHVCCNKGKYTAHSGHRCYNCYCSGISSPQHYVDECSLWRHDMKSNNWWHNDHDSYLRERTHSIKRHLRPVAGGAPIIACYNCLELLQLPADFLLFRRTCHWLRCSACSKVLKFSLQNRIHIVPYTSDIIAPPPSEISDHSNAISSRRVALESRSKNFADRMSCRSTEQEPTSLASPFQILKRNPNERKMSSSSSFEPVEERKKKPILKESQNKNKNPVQTFESAGSSLTMSKPEKVSEIEELPPKGLTLHWLMGYGSPSEVISGSGLGTSSQYPEKGPNSWN